MQNIAGEVAINTAHIAANTEIVQHLVDVGKIFGPFALIIISLLVYTWSQKEKTQDKLEQAFITHIKEDDTCHNKIFNEIRDTNHKLDTLIGEHISRKDV